MSQQYDKTHSTTIVVTVAVPAHRFVAYSGALAAGLGGTNDAQGVSECDAKPGEALSVVTGYSYLVEAGGNFAFGDFVKPGAGGVAIIGSATDHCGRALCAGVLGQLAEIQLLRHTHP